VLAAVRRSAGNTAYEVAFDLNETSRYTSISSILAKLAAAGKVERRHGTSARSGQEISWRYYPKP
jgi:hypothetical protein